jgi:putative inorganic carbon (HCO3(-)) transporter
MREMIRRNIADHPGAPPAAQARLRVGRALRILPVAADSDLRLPSILLAAIILTLPLQATKTLFPIQQIEVSRLLIGVAIAWWLVRGRAYGWPFPSLLSVSLASLGVMLFASLVVTRWSNGVLLVLAPAFYLGFATFVATVIRSPAALRFTGLMLAISGVMVAVISLVLQYFDIYLWRADVLGVLGRTNSTFADPNIAARFLIIAIIVLIAGGAMIGLRQRRPLGLVAIALTLLAAAMVLTQSRFGWITLALTLALLLVFVRPRTLAAGFIVLFVITFVGFSLVNGTASGRATEFAAALSYSLGADVPIDERGNLIGSEDETYDPPREVLGHDLFRRLPIDGVRYYLIESGMAMWQDNPAFGVGVGGFQPNLLGPYQAFIPTERLVRPVSLPHTFLTQVAAENGWVGLTLIAIFLGVLAGVALRAARAADPTTRLAAILAGLTIVAVFLSSQVAGGFLVEPYLWLAIGVLAAAYRLARSETTVAEAE